MKKVISLLACALVCVTIIVACSKDQKVVKQLDGTWKVTGVTVDGTAQPASTFDTEVYTFSECKVKKGDCDGTVSDPPFTLPFKYKISDKGETITMTFNLLGTNQTETGKIIEHSKSKFVFSTVDNGKTTITTLEK